MSAVQFPPQLGVSVRNTFVHCTEDDSLVTPIVARNRSKTVPADVLNDAVLKATLDDANDGTGSSEGSDGVNPASKAEESDEEEGEFPIPFVKTRDFFEDTPHGAHALKSLDPFNGVHIKELDMAPPSPTPPSLHEGQPGTGRYPALLLQQHTSSADASKDVIAEDAAAACGLWAASNAPEVVSTSNETSTATAARPARRTCKARAVVVEPSPSATEHATGASTGPMYVEHSLAAPGTSSSKACEAEEASGEIGPRLTVSVRNTFLHIDEAEGGEQTPVFHQRAGRRSKTGPAGMFVLGNVSEDSDEAEDGKASAEDDQPCKIPVMQMPLEAALPGQSAAKAKGMGATPDLCMPMPLPMAMLPPFCPSFHPFAPLLAQISAAQAAQIPVPAPQAAPQTKAKEPRASDFAAGCPSKTSVGERTTVVLQNLPLNYRRPMLARMLDSEGFAGEYDFIYLPMDFKTRAGFGYAFINLARPSVVARFWDVFDGYKKWMFPSAKVCRVSWSVPHQGLKAHMKRYRNSPLMHESVPDEYKPALFSGGARVPFPPPTKEIAPPSQKALAKAPKGSKQKAPAA